MGFIGWLVSIVYKSFFLFGDEGYRKAHYLSKIIFVSVVLLLMMTIPERAYLMSFIIIPLGLLSPHPEWILASTILSSLAGLYLSISAYILSFTGLYYMETLQILEIAGRAIGFSLSLIFIFATISPIEIHNLLYFLRSKRSCVFPLLLWRLVPYGLKNFMDSLSVGSLKGEQVTKRIPPAVASMIEIGRFIDEYCYWRLKTGVKTPLKLNKNSVYTFLLIVGSVATILVTTL
ncbi:MAG: hypothetical protein QXK88_03310 [Desulfurococcaceae archaeon]